MKISKTILTLYLILNLQIAYCQEYSKLDTIITFESNSIENGLEIAKIIAQIADTIDSNTDNRKLVWTINENIDTVNKIIEFQLLFDQQNDFFNCNVYNVFSIELSRYDSIIVEGLYTNRIDTLEKSISEFIKFDHNNFLQEKENKQAIHLDNKSITRNEFFIGIEIIADSNGVRSSLEIFDNIISKVLNCYVILRNEFVKNTWDVSYNALEFEKKSYISVNYPIILSIFPYKIFIKPPPPPPYEQTEQYKIDSMTNSYFDKLMREGLHKKE
jgi:hypothetical protein